jgi:hypothetical protein
VPTPQGGTHIVGMRQGLLDAMRDFCESRNLFPRGIKLTADDIKIVNLIKDYLVKRKLDFVGIDVIGKYLTEINVTSPTCLVEIENQTNFDCAKFIIDTL